jgi:hypothetical protein
VLLPRRIDDGELSVSAAQFDLEQAITGLAAEQAEAHGITIEQVRLALCGDGARSIVAKARIEARKLVRANIEISGQLDIDDNLRATISQLHCQGAGMIGAGVCSALRPQLAAFNGRTFSLKSLPLGETQVRDVRITVTDRVELRLSFGSPNA